MRKVNSETLKLAIILTKDIDELGLSTLSYNSLRRWGIYTIADLCEARIENRIKKIRGIGGKSIIEIDHALEHYFRKNNLEVEYETD